MVQGLRMAQDRQCERLRAMMFGLVGNPDIKPIADEVDQKPRGVLDRI